MWCSTDSVSLQVSVTWIGLCVFADMWLRPVLTLIITWTSPDLYWSELKPHCFLLMTVFPWKPQSNPTYDNYLINTRSMTSSAVGESGSRLMWISSPRLHQWTEPRPPAAHRGRHLSDVAWAGEQRLGLPDQWGLTAWRHPPIRTQLTIIELFCNVFYLNLFYIKCFIKFVAFWLTGVSYLSVRVFSLSDHSSPENTQRYIMPQIFRLTWNYIIRTVLLTSPSFF